MEDTSISQALSTSAEEREKRDQCNFVHVTAHAAQQWAETSVSGLNDSVVEAPPRTRQVPSPLPFKEAIQRYLWSNNRLLILGFNATLTETIDTPGRRGDQTKEMELKLHPDLKEHLIALCSDPKTTIVVLSGSDRKVLDENFGEYDMWLAAENGMFLRVTKGEWMTAMPEHLNIEWVDGVKHVFEYFKEKTPGSDLEVRETSLVWNYKYSDVEFGRLQAKDMLQHLQTGRISDASFDVVQGSRSIEVRAAGVTKGAAMTRICGEIAYNNKSIMPPIDYVLCMGHFLGEDEDVYTFFEPELSMHGMAVPSTATGDGPMSTAQRRSSLKLPDNRGGSKSSNNNTQRFLPKTERTTNYSVGSGGRASREEVSWNVLDLKGENYFSCAVGRTKTSARYTLNSSHDVVSFLKKLARASLTSASAAS